MRNARFIAGLLLAAAPVYAQQPNTIFSTMAIDGNDGPAYPMNITARTNTVSNIFISGAFANKKFLVATSATGQLQVAAAAVAGGSMDLPFSPPNGLWINGFYGPGSSVFQTNVIGEINIPISIPPSYPTVGAASHVSVQMIIENPASPFLYTLSAATHAQIVVGPVVTNYFFTDDSFNTVTLSGWTFPFYGTAYSTLYLNENGFLLMGATSSDFSSSPTQMWNGPPRIAPFWCDLDTSSNPGAIVRSTIDNNPPGDFPNALFEFISVLDWVNVGGAGFVHTFSWRINNQGLIDFYESFLNTASIYETMVCIAPGAPNNIGGILNIAGVGGIVDTPPNFKVGTLNEQFWEWFGQTTMISYDPSLGNRPYDLAGRNLQFIPSHPIGNPPPANPVTWATRSYTMIATL